MKSPFCQNRPGATLIELILFIGLMGMMAATAIPFLFAATESRQRQDAIALVEQNGAQLLQVLTQEVRSAERVLDPGMGGTGTVLALQTDDPATNPTIFARQSGSLIMVQGTGRTTLSSPLVGISGFWVDNTSTSEDRQSVTVSFAVKRTIRLHQPLIYESLFDAVITLFPDDAVSGDDCGCGLPYCDTASGSYIWQVCEDSVCVPYTDFSCVQED